MLLKGEHLVTYRRERLLFCIESLEIHEGDRIGLVGPNGIGKSTLLHGLYGDAPFDEGMVTRRSAIAMITQEAAVTGAVSPMWAKRLGLGVTAASGGERMRRAIAAAMSADAPLIFADEPTTSLDMDGIELVEGLLARYRGAVVVVSHDRRLLDNVCTTIWALDNGGLRVFPGNYSAYAACMEQERARAFVEYQQYQAEKSRLEEAARQVRSDARKMTNTSHLVAKGCSTKEIRGAKPFFEAAAGRKAKRAKALERRITQLTVKEKPQALPQIQMQLGLGGPLTARKAVTVKDLTVGYGERAILEHVSFTLPTGSRTVVIGPNGSGKSTLIKALLAEDNPAIEKARGLAIGYFAQNHEQLEEEATVLANARAQSTQPEHVVRTILARLRLGAGELEKTPAKLSGGQRAKLAFARLLASDCNLLILDEPTNHLDGFAADSLEKLLKEWGGTLLVVTHDRELAEQVADRLLIVGAGRVTSFAGGWRAYRESLRAAPAEAADAQLDQLTFDLRKAELAGKIALARQKNHDTAALEEQWQALLQSKRLLPKGEN